MAIKEYTEWIIDELLRLNKVRCTRYEFEHTKLTTLERWFALSYYNEWELRKRGEKKHVSSKNRKRRGNFGGN